MTAIGQALAAPAMVVLGKDDSFPNRIKGLPTKRSDFSDLQIHSFETNDGVTPARAGMAIG